MNKPLVGNNLDFKNATRNSYQHWINAFSEFISEVEGNIFVPMSAGHDSGLIVAELIEQEKRFEVVYCPYLEDIEVLRQRREILGYHGIPSHKVILNRVDLDLIPAYLRRNLSYYALQSPDDTFRNYKDLDFRKSSGSMAFFEVCNKASKMGMMRGISGQGADEIIADYYCPPHNPAMSCFKGDWTKADHEWPNINGGWNRVFYDTAGMIAELAGVEFSYPFLDYNVVQAFLWLTPEAKGREYKAPITARLRELDFPYHMHKQGFAGARY